MEPNSVTALPSQSHNIIHAKRARRTMSVGEQEATKWAQGLTL